MKLQPSRRSQRRKHQSAACAVLRACAAGIPKDPTRPQPCGSATPDQRSVLPQPPGRNSSARCRGWMLRTAADAMRTRGARVLYLNRASTMQSIERVSDSPCYQHHPYGILAEVHVQMVLNLVSTTGLA